MCNLNVSLICYYNPITNTRHKKRTNEFSNGYDIERFVEALKGQGCEVHIWSLESWAAGWGKSFWENCVK